MNTNSKNWSLTWETNRLQRKLPPVNELQKFFNKYADQAIFQIEEGKQKKNKHIQGIFILSCYRKSKKVTFKLFEQNFKNTAGLTLSPVHDRLALESYVQKEDGRIAGPYYAGNKQVYNEEMATIPLRKWQKDLFDLITGPDQEKLKDRIVIWVEDPQGRAGKSWFQKWLRCGQRKIQTRNLPIDRSDRLAAAINIIAKTTSIDAYCFDLTRTKGFDQHYEDLFNTVEHIKNGMVISCWRGIYEEALFSPPIVLLFSNREVEPFVRYLSYDRWKVFTIDENQNLVQRKIDFQQAYTHHLSKDEK
jgi:hypothetical protein